MAVVNIIAFIIILIGAINWGLIGLFNWNLVEAIFRGRNFWSRLIYVIVFLSAIWLIIGASVGAGLIALI